MHHPKLKMQQRPIARKPGKDGERGASLVEYALLLAMIAVVVFSAVSFFGSSTGGGFNKSQGCLAAAYDNTPKPPGCP